MSTSTLSPSVTLTERVDVYSLPEGLLLTPVELSEILQIPVATLKAFRVEGRRNGPRFRKLGRNIRYRVSDVIEWIESQ